MKQNKYFNTKSKGSDSKIEITEEQFDEIGNILNQKLRYGLFYMLFV